MANLEYLKILKQGVAVWNRWRTEHPEIRLNLFGIDLSGMYLAGIDFSDVYLRQAKLVQTDLRFADFSEANLHLADLREADIRSACFHKADLTAANFSGANLSNEEYKYDPESWLDHRANFTRATLQGAILRGVDLSGADFRWADLWRADLSEATLHLVSLKYAQLIETVLERASLTDCWVYGISAWRVKLEDTYQSDLIISSSTEPHITVDNLEVAQFIYLLEVVEEFRYEVWSSAWLGVQWGSMGDEHCNRDAPRPLAPRESMR